MFLGIQEGAIAALNLDEAWISSMNAIYETRKSLVLEMAGLLRLEVQQGGAGMFVWAKVPAYVSALDLVGQLLYEKDIFITPGAIFGSRGTDYVRFSLCVKEEKIKEALNRLAN